MCINFRMKILSEEEINQALVDFYEAIESNRNRHYKENHGEEPTYFRNPMIKFLLEHLEDESVAADMLSGDIVVPLAILYLQKEIPELRKLRKVYAVDNDADGGFELIRKNAEYFGFESQVVPIKADAGEDSLVSKIEEKADVTTVIEGSRYVDQGYVHDSDQFFNNLAVLAPLNFTIQVGFIPFGYTEKLEKRFEVEEGLIKKVRGQPINYQKGIVKGASK